jgi:hypothetical protein
MLISVILLLINVYCLIQSHILLTCVIVNIYSFTGWEGLGVGLDYGDDLSFL